MIMRLLVPTLLLLTFALGCQPQPERYDGRTKPSEAKGTSDSEEPEYRQFRIFDPTYDYNTADAQDAQAMATRFPIHTDGSSQVAFLKDGADFYAARMQLLSQATKSVRIQSLIFHADESGYEVANKLIDLAKKGIKVHVVIDPVANFKFDDQKMFYNLQRYGVTVEGYELLYLNLLDFFSGKGDDFEMQLTQANMRYHEKLFIIDGEDPEKARAIIGGVNIANEYFRVKTDDPYYMWQDRDVIVRGPVVQEMTVTFDRNEQEMRISRLKLSHIQFAWSVINAVFGDPKDIVLDLDTERLARLRSYASTPLELDWQPVDIRFLQSRPRFKEDFIFPAYIDMINSAKEEILLNNAYFIADRHLAAPIAAAVQRGVKVRIVTNGPKAGDAPQLAKVARTKYKLLLSVDDNLSADLENPGNLELYEWAGDLVLNNGQGQNHAKYMVVDRKAVVVGSYNMDPRSRYLNTESVVIFENAEEAAKYGEVFDEEISERYSIKITDDQATEFAKDPEGLGAQFEMELLKLITPLL